jgi:hypothetical protein
VTIVDNFSYLHRKEKKKTGLPRNAELKIEIVFKDERNCQSCIQSFSNNPPINDGVAKTNFVSKFDNFFRPFVCQRRCRRRRRLCFTERQGQMSSTKTSVLLQFREQVRKSRLTSPKVLIKTVG